MDGQSKVLQGGLRHGNLHSVLRRRGPGMGGRARRTRARARACSVRLHAARGDCSPVQKALIVCVWVRVSVHATRHRRGMCVMAVAYIAPSHAMQRRPPSPLRCWLLLATQEAGPCSRRPFSRWGRPLPTAHNQWVPISAEGPYAARCCARERGCRLLPTANLPVSSSVSLVLSAICHFPLQARPTNLPRVSLQSLQLLRSPIPRRPAQLPVSAVFALRRRTLRHFHPLIAATQGRSFALTPNSSKLGVVSAAPFLHSAAI